MLWNSRITVAVLTGGLALLIADAAGLLPSGPATGWIEAILGIAVFLWVVYWFGFVFTLRLELTSSGRVRWFGAVRQGSFNVADIERITNVFPLLWIIHHANGRLVAFVADMKGFRNALDEVRAAGGESTTSTYHDAPPQD